MFEPKARILMVIRQLGGRAGGAERLFCETSNMFAEAGYEVTIAYCDPSQDPPPYRLSPKIARFNLWASTPRQAAWYKALDKVGSLKTRWLAPADWLAKNLYFVRRLHAIARHAKPDVIVSFLPPANTPSLIAGWLSGANVVPTNHNVPEHDYASKKRWDQNPIDKFLRLRMLKKASRVHVLFPTFAGWFPDDVRAKVVAIPNPVSEEFLQPAAAPIERAKEIVGVGRLTDVKNYATLVDAWSYLAAKYPDWKVKIYGAGPQRKLLDKRIRELALEGQVVMMGQDHDIKPAYLRAEILAHPAQFEGFGLSVAEALACGLPVVAFADCAGVNEFVHDGDNGILVDRAGGARALAAGLERLIVDEKLRHEIRARTRPSIEAYSLAAFRRRWTALIEDVIRS